MTIHKKGIIVACSNATTTPNLSVNASSARSVSDTLDRQLPGVNPQLASVLDQMNRALDIVRGLGDSLRSP